MPWMTQPATELRKTWLVVAVAHVFLALKSQSREF
jgi:hypothetical protein